MAASARSRRAVRRKPASLTKAQERAIFAVIEKALPQLMSVQSRGGWWPIIQESNTGAFQRNEPLNVDTVLTNPTIFACQRLIATDIAKMHLRLVSQDADGIWSETESPSFSPFLRKPNHFQNRITFIENWVLSKLNSGNTYVLKQRDQRGVVVKGYVLDPTRARPLVAPDQSVFYELRTDHLSGLPEQVIAPAREIMHDIYLAPFHPLVGVSPIFAAGLSAIQGLNILTNSSSFFANGSNPGGVITAPKSISQANADAVAAAWNEGFTGDNFGKVAVLGDGMTYSPIGMKAQDAQLVEQLKLTAEMICQCYGVPAYMVGVGAPPAYNNIEALNQQYYSQCLQTLIEKIEETLDLGLGLAPDKIDGVRYGTEFDIDDLLRMDTATLITAEKEAVSGGIKAPNESRRRLNLKGVIGGDTPYLQQQNYSLSALDARDRNNPAPSSASGGSAPPPVETPPDAKGLMLKAFRDRMAA